MFFFLFDALNFVDHVPSRLKCCNDNASMKNLNSLFFIYRHTNRRQKPTMHHWGGGGGGFAQCTSFITTQQTNQTVDVAKPPFSSRLFKEKCEEYFVAFFFTQC